MRPGAWTSDGFLHPGDSLSVVMSADAARVRELDTDVRALGDALLAAIAAGEGTDFLRPRTTGDLSVEIHRQRGLITCPWAPDEGLACEAGSSGRPTANQFIVANRRSGARLAGFELTAHLIAEHGFFGGPGTRFRIEPDLLVEVLGSAR